MREFRNAYHFIPVKPPATVTPYPQSAGFGKTPNTEAMGHAVYAAGTISGRIHCRVVLEQPTVIGAERTANGTGAATVAPFMFKGKAAIPATSLKGLLSSLAEVASQSAYRILDNPALTVGYGYPTYETWHRKTNIGNVHNYVAPALRPDAGLSAADQLFGFVRAEKVTDGTLAGLAGKLRISHATLTAECAAKPDAEIFDATVPLKILSQPMKNYPRDEDRAAGADPTYRSATPNFYMRETTGASSAHITKRGFATGPTTKYEIQGQKAYLHHAKASAADPQPWASKKQNPNNQQASVCPIKAGVAFDFDILFDNLTDAELNLLCFALCPSERFRHKIGYGKPLGLGSVRIRKLKLEIVDRATRYTTGSVFAAPAPAPGDHQVCAANHTTWLRENDPDALNAILKIGETHDFCEGDTAPVAVLWVPLTTTKFDANNAGTEDKSHEWSQKNDNNKHPQRLAPITPDGIPTLETNGPNN